MIDINDPQDGWTAIEFLENPDLTRRFLMAWEAELMGEGNEHLDDELSKLTEDTA